MYTTMLELAMSMVFLFLMLSAASSAIQEIIANIFRWRAKTLENGIAGLLQSEQFKNKLYNLPLLQGLSSPNARGQNTHKPSYIPSSTFALAVLQLVEQEGLSLSSTPSAATGSSALAEAVLRPLLRGANDVAEQKKRLEDWFDNSMDRISGWYKRRSHAALWIIGALLCIFVNADSISLASAFWNDPTLRSAVVTAATEYVKDSKQSKPGDTDSVPKVPGTPRNAPAQPVSTTPPANNGVPPDTRADAAKGKTPNATQPAEKSSDDPFKRLDEVRGKLSNVNIPLGWCLNSNQGERCFPILNTKPKTAMPAQEISDPRLIKTSGGFCDQILWWFLKVLGLAVTALAISQGAPFWFDLLQKAVNLRLAGDAPDEKQKT